MTFLLDAFEERLVEVAVASSPFVTEASRHIIGAGGKSFRPLLVFLSSLFGGGMQSSLSGSSVAVK